MSNLSSFGTLSQHVKKIYDESDIEKVGEAFDIFALKTILKLNDDEIEEAITDGGMDGGIDAIHIVERTVHFFNCKYTDNFEHTKRNFPENEIDKVIVTIDSIYSGSLDKDTVNTAIWEKYEEIKNLFNDGPLDFKIHLASNKEKPIDRAKVKLENALMKYRRIDFNYYDQEDLVSELLEEDIKKTDGQLTFLQKMHFEKSDGNMKTIVGVIAADDLIELITEEDTEVVNEHIFNENIRVYKPKHRINKEIIDSALAEDNYYFFYLNNGITILCDECDYVPNSRSPRAHMKNIQIINGGQTSHSLFEAFKKDKEKIKNIELLVRVCITDRNDPIASKISETSNNQIPVNTRDLHSNDRVQLKLEKEFSVLGYCYERKPNQYLDISKDLILSNEILGQIYLSYVLDKASEAKNSKTIVFSNMYDEIFDEEKINASLLLKLYKIYLPLLARKKIIQKKKRKKEPINEQEAFVSRATFHLLNVIKLLISHDETQIRENFDKKEEIDLYLDGLYTQEKIDEYIETAISLVYEVILKEIKNRGDFYTHDKFFKEIQTNTIIKNYVIEELQKRGN